MSTTKPLTKPQLKLLARVRAAGVLNLNGRAKKSVMALFDAGLITYTYNLVPYTFRVRHRESFTIRPAAAK